MIKRFIHAISKLIFDSTSVLFILLKMTSIFVERVVLSGYIMNVNTLLELAISFTYIVKSKGPSMVTFNISD